ncbi:MAG: hypothetical protein AAFV29_18880, partial [Myxococcota bacterium]
VGVRTRRVDIPKSRADLASTIVELARVVQGDLDADGRPDVLTVVGTETHRLVALYDRGNGRFEFKTGIEMPGTARSIEIVRAGDGPSIVTLFRAQRNAVRLVDVGESITAYAIEEPRFEIWRGFQNPASTEDVVLPDAPDILTDFNGNTIFQVGIAMDAGDIDDDGYDELVASRCSYFVNPVTGNRNRFNKCYGGSIDDRLDSELVVLSAIVDAQGEVIDFEERATVPSFALPSGYRTAQFTDLNGDGDLDIISSNFLQVIGVCGDRGLPSQGFGFSSPDNRFFAATGFSDNFGLAAGRFNDDPFMDVISTGAFRPNSPDAGFSVVPAVECNLPISLPAVVSGSRTEPELLAVRTADLNNDGWDDVLFLDRAAPRLQLFFGAGTNLLAPGPTIALPGGPSAEFDVISVGSAQAPMHRAAIPARGENAVYMIEFWPDVP